MKSIFPFKTIKFPGMVKSLFTALILTCLVQSTFAQKSGIITVTDDQQLIDAVSNPNVSTIFIEPGYYASADKLFGSGMKAVKPLNHDGNRDFQCVYAIQQSITCFNPIAPETYVSSIASASTLDLFACGCCPPSNAGSWSFISGPGNIIIDFPLNELTTFSVDEPGEYTLRYTWPAPWNSFVETVYLFYNSYTAEIQADDVCGLSTMVHFEYRTVEGDPGATLEWTLNGIPYDGPEINPAGDTVDFSLTVPACGEWVLQATLTPSNCDPVSVSDTIVLKGESAPVIAGVLADTTVICPNEPVFSEPTVYDPCDPNATLTFVTDSIPGDCPDSYTLIRTWTATNECGYSSSDSQTIVHLPNPNPEIVSRSPVINADEPIIAGCNEDVSIPFPEIITPCGPATVSYDRSDGGNWEDPYGSGTTDVCFWGVSPCGFSTDTTCFQVIVGPCEDSQFCSLTQGFYGNYGGTFCNGMGTSALIQSLLAQGDLVIGFNGNTMTFHSGESDCIIDLLPGGGPAKKITGSNTCASHPGIQMKKGRINNILLAQTITLGLNLRLDGELGALNIYSDTLTTAPSSGCNNDGDTITGPYVKYSIPVSVYNVLSQNGNITPTVNDLFALANTGLGGGAVGATTLSAISDAVSRINEGFDECAFGQFELQLELQSMAIQGEIAKEKGDINPGLRIFPNPFSSGTNIEFTAQDNEDAVVEVYTLTGYRVAVLYNGKVEEGITYNFTFTGDPVLKQMTYMCVVRTGNETNIQRILMVR